MPSPFPGMDPYLEDPAFWQDFHARFVPNCCDALNDVLPEKYDARIETLTQLVDISAGELRLMEPDLFISRPRSAGRSRARTKATATLDQVVLRAPQFREVRDHWIRVLYRSEEVVITVIEVLSPTNKGSGYQDYQRKRDRLLARNVHFVEIDLLVGGRRPEIESDWPSGEYYALTARAEQRPRADVKSWTVRDPLPAVPVPLRAPDPDVMLDLAAVFATTYERGRYARVLNYAASPPVPLPPDDLAWATGRAKAAAAR